MKAWPVPPTPGSSPVPLAKTNSTSEQDSAAADGTAAVTAMTAQVVARAAPRKPAIRRVFMSSIPAHSFRSRSREVDPQSGKQRCLFPTAALKKQKIDGLSLGCTNSAVLTDRCQVAQDRARSRVSVLGLLGCHSGPTAGASNYRDTVGYPENVLAADERVVLHSHPHWKRLVGAMLVLLLASPLASFTAAVVHQTDWNSTARDVVILVILVVWLVVVGWLTVWPVLNWRATHFVITDRRVMFRHGVLTRSGIDIPLARINSVEFRHGLIDRILRTGTLIIESASQDPLEFHDIPRVERVHSLLYHEVFDTLGSDESPS